MERFGEAVDILAAQPVCGYARDATPTVEPTALAALALVAVQRDAAAAPALDWLATVQAADGGLGVSAELSEPIWPTGWAVVSWNAAARRVGAKTGWSDAAQKAVAKILATRGLPIAESAERGLCGHDTRLIGWPWVVGTHSWVEPTAISLMALRSAGQTAHPRYREAVRLLLDRQLPSGGWNYGNTAMLQHVTQPQSQATGLTLAALAEEPDIRPRVRRSLDWLVTTLSPKTTTASLCYGLMGMAAFGLCPTAAPAWLSAAAERTFRAGGSPYHLALLVLAAKKGEHHGSTD